MLWFPVSKDFPAINKDYIKYYYFTALYSNASVKARLTLLSMTAVVTLVP